MELNDFFRSVEEGMLARFRQAGLIQHAGDRGEYREHILMDFLKNHLPKKYGVVKGEIVTQTGQHGHAADIIIYDAINAPVLYAENTAVLPIEAVYGIVEVKSTLSKSEFLDAVRKVQAFKKLAPRELSVVST